MEDRPLASWKSFFKGILGGSLASAGIFSIDFGISAQIGIFIIGLLIVIDALISKTEEIYPLTMFLGLIVGFFASLFSVIGKVNLHYTLLILILVALVYVRKLLLRLGKK